MFVYTRTEEGGTKPSICSLYTNTIEHKAEHLKYKSSFINQGFVYCTAKSKYLMKAAKSMSEDGTQVTSEAFFLEEASVDLGLSGR